MPAAAALPVTEAAPAVPEPVEPPEASAASSLTGTDAAAARQHCYDLVEQYARSRDEYLQKAGKEYQAGRPQVAAVYSADARRYSEWMKQELERAVTLAVEHR